VTRDDLTVQQVAFTMKIFTQNLNFYDRLFLELQVTMRQKMKTMCKAVSYGTDHITTYKQVHKMTKVRDHPTRYEDTAVIISFSR